MGFDPASGGSEAGAVCKDEGGSAERSCFMVQENQIKWRVWAVRLSWATRPPSRYLSVSFYRDDQ